MLTQPLPRTYRKWSSMLQRCYNPKHPAYRYYGGRGISVCPQWTGRGGYEVFLSDMGEAPAGLTLDRIDNDRGYEPGNCRWATWKEQFANRRPGGPPKNPDSLAGRARSAGLPYRVVYLRVKVLMWPEERALTTPVRPWGSRVKRRLDVEHPTSTV